MRLLLLVTIILLISTQCFSQDRIRIATPNGDSTNYVRERSRVIFKHDTTTIERNSITASHDREFYFIETRQPQIFSIDISLPADTTSHVLPPIETHHSALGVFGYADFHGAVVAPALTIDLTAIQLWIYAGAYYSSEIHRTNPVAGVSAFAPLWRSK